MGRKFFKQRYTDRHLDTMAVSGTQTGSRSFFTRDSFSTSVFAATWLNPVAAGRAPQNSYVPGKAATRADSILYTDLKIPTYSKILSAQMYLTHSIAPSANHTFRTLDIAIYPDLQSRDVDKWRGRKGGQDDYVWVRTQLSNNERVTTVNNNAGNFWVKIQEGATIRAQTNVAAAAVATQGAMQIGREQIDKYTNLSSEFIQACGNVVQIESSSAIADTVIFRLRKAGGFTSPPHYIVAKVYEYDVATRTIGALRATSDSFDASTLTTSATAEATFTFTSVFSVTANEYVFVTVEPLTEWARLALGQGNGYVIAGFMPSLKNSDTGANPAGSEEVMWSQPTVGGNQSVYFQFDQVPALYSGVVGRVFECYPYQRSVGVCPFRTMPSAAGEVSILDFPSNLLRALENYNRDKDIAHDIQGVMWFLSSAGAAGDNQGLLTWSTATTATIGVNVVYRSTRTFIT